MAADRFSLASVETHPLLGLSRLRTLSYTAVPVPRRGISSKFPGFWIRNACSNNQRRRSAACLSSKQTPVSASTDSASSSSSSSSPEFGLVSSKACSDGSTVFLFGDVSETPSLYKEEAEANDGSLNKVASNDFPDEEDSREISAREVTNEDEAGISEVAIKSFSSADIIGSEIVDNEETAVSNSSPPNEENTELEIIDEGKEELNENPDEVVAAKSLSSEDKLELQSHEKTYQEESTVSVGNNLDEITSRTLTSEGIDIGLELEAEEQEKGEVTEVDTAILSSSYVETISSIDAVLDENNREEVTARVDYDHTAELEEVADNGSNIDDDSDSNNTLDTELLDVSSLGNLETTSESPQPSAPLGVSSSITVLEENLNLGTEENTVLEEETSLEDLTASSNGRPDKAASEEEVLQTIKAVDTTVSINSEGLLQSDTLDKDAVIDETSAEEEVLWATEAVDMTDSIYSKELSQSDTHDEGAIIEEAEKKVLKATEAVDITDSINSVELLQSDSPDEGDDTAIIEETSAKELLQVKAADIIESVSLEDLSESEMSDDNTTATIDEILQEKDWDGDISTGSEVEINESSAKEDIVDLPVAFSSDEHSAVTSISENCEERERLPAVADESEKTEEISSGVENISTENNMEGAEKVIDDLPTTPIMNEDSAESADTSIKASISENSVEPEKLLTESRGEEEKDNTVASTLDTDTTNASSVSIMNEDSAESADTSIKASISENSVEPEMLLTESGGEEEKDNTVASTLDTDTTNASSVSIMNEDSAESADTSIKASISENSVEPEMLLTESGGEEEKDNTVASTLDTDTTNASSVSIMNEDSAESADTSIKASISENSVEPEMLLTESGGEEEKDNTVASTLDTDTTKAPSLDNGVTSNQEATEDGEERYDIAEVNSMFQSQSEDVILNSEEIIPIELSLSSAAASLPHPSTVVGGKDAYFIAGKNWVGVADGAAHWSWKGTSDGLFAQELMKNCKAIVSDSKSSSVTDVLVTSVAETDSVGISTVLLAHFDGQALSVAIIGDSGFIVIRDGTLLKRSVPMAHEFSFPVQIGKDDDPSELVECYRIELALNDVLVSATNGLFDNLYDQEIASIVHKALQQGLTPQEIAEVLVTGADEAARSGKGPSPFSDSAHTAGYVGYSGGKLDDITVVVSVVCSED